MFFCRTVFRRETRRGHDHCRDAPPRCAARAGGSLDRGRSGVAAVRGLELKVPPPAIVLVTAALMWLASRAVPAFEIPIPARTILAVGLAVAGAVATVLDV